ncbi:hypothetical protein E3N88_46313 [Mikania micrantha]|uniref:Hexosyltransferase n=1 Tax=Mikania micrantha TaxID=192012 RepID=A0A5N6L6S9_9ASTR|nr:hypothetical protein E3N88_46313 [Mikania micrantha]
MQWIIRFSGFVSAMLLMIVLAPSLQSFHPAEAIRSYSHIDGHIRLPGRHISVTVYRRAPTFRNAAGCEPITGSGDVCDPSLVHVALTLDFEYLRGSIAAVHSILQHSSCPESMFFHFLVSDTSLKTLVGSTFPKLKFKVYYFEPEVVRKLISASHGLGGDNVKGSCRDLHPGPVSLLHWSGSGKPWLRLDSKQACPLDALWGPYDLYRHSA